MIEVPAMLYRYLVADGNRTIVYLYRTNKVLPPMSVFWYAAASCDRQHARRFVLGIRPDKHEISMSVGGWNMLTTRSGWLRWLIHFGCRSAVWLHWNGPETDTPLVRREKKSPYMLSVAHMLRRLWRSILNGNTTQNLVVPHVDLCCFGYPFPMAGFSICCDHFSDSLAFEQCFWESTNPFFAFVLRYCDEAFLACIREYARFLGFRGSS